jgi:hypothetical protein
LEELGIRSKAGDIVGAEALQEEVRLKTELLKSKDERIHDLQQQLGFLQSEIKDLTARIPVLPAPKRGFWAWFRKDKNRIGQ